MTQQLISPQSRGEGSALGAAWLCTGEASSESQGPWADALVQAACLPCAWLLYGLFCGMHFSNLCLCLFLLEEMSLLFLTIFN